MNTVICPNCGAAIYDTEPKCPFCGYINIAGAEEKFMQDMAKTEENLSRIPELQKRQLKKSMSKSSKIILITIAVVALIGAILVGFFWLVDNVIFDYGYDVKAEAIWERENYPYLDKLYEEGKYDEILEYSWDLYDINDEEGTNHSIHNWEHADFIYTHGSYQKLKRFETILDSGEKLSVFEAEDAVCNCMRFYFREYMGEYSVYTEEELTTLEEYRDFASAFLFERLKFTKEEAEDLYESIMEDGYMDYDKCYKYARKIRKRFE